MNQIDSTTLFFAAIFTNNILLTNFLGLCPFLSISRQIKSAFGLGVAVAFVMGSTAALNNLVLLPPASSLSSGAFQIYCLYHYNSRFCPAG